MIPFNSGRPSAERSAEVGNLQQHLVLDCGLPCLRRGQLRSDHHLRQLAGVDLRRCGGPHGVAASHDRDPVGNREHLVELVRDEDDGLALIGELTYRIEELVDLLGHQNRRRLVEDEDLRPPIEDLDDLDPLSLPHRQRLDPLARD